MELSVIASHSDPWTVLTVHGELDMASAPALRQKVVSLGPAERFVVLDLRGVGFIDSTGLGVVVGLLKRLRTADGELRIACDEPRVRRIFEITDLTRVFTLYESADTAVADPHE